MWKIVKCYVIIVKVVWLPLLKGAPSVGK